MLSFVSHSGWAQTRPSEYRREARVIPLIALPLRVSLTGPPFFRYVTGELLRGGNYSLLTSGSCLGGISPCSSIPGSLDGDKASVKPSLDRRRPGQEGSQAIPSFRRKASLEGCRPRNSTSKSMPSRDPPDSRTMRRYSAPTLGLVTPSASKRLNMSSP